jgi:hypothetical protein
MILKIRIGRWRFTFSMAPLTDVVGVDSTLPDGNHILMWDFDDIPLNQVTHELQSTQYKYNLPKIYLLETKPNQNYIAYCFKNTLWRQTVEIIASCPSVDWNFFKYGVYRGKFTLRVGPKCGRIPKLALILRSDEPETCTVKQLKSWVKYETLEDNYMSKLLQLEVW